MNKPTLFGVLASGSIRYSQDGELLQRLFSTFANGGPGKGLMILRLAASSFLVHDSFLPLAKAASDRNTVLPIASAAAGILLLLGLWTPVAGILVTLLEIWIAFSRTGEPSASVLAAAIALSLALLGPGAWSIDARTYGRKRISISSSGGP